jgi:tRNA(fMet)-specific endonuclease VapC
MNGKFLLDTNIAIAFLVADKSLQRPDASAQLYISCTAIGELFYGALNSNQVDANIQRLVDFIHDAVSVPCDHETARVYGEIKTALRGKGRPIPDNDIWIAAVAMQHSLSLVSRDEHFANIERLNLVRW